MASGTKRRMMPSIRRFGSRILSTWIAENLFFASALDPDHRSPKDQTGLVRGKECNLRDVVQENEEITKRSSCSRWGAEYGIRNASRTPISICSTRLEDGKVPETPRKRQCPPSSALAPHPARRVLRTPAGSDFGGIGPNPVGEKPTIEIGAHQRVNSSPVASGIQ